MPFCGKCGCELSSEDCFCKDCGTPIDTYNYVSSDVNISSSQSFSNYNSIYISYEKYTPNVPTFTFQGLKFSFSEEMDKYNYYRKLFKMYAKQGWELAKEDYIKYISDLDSFFIIFPQIYESYRKPLVHLAQKIMIQHEIYDITAENISSIHIQHFSQCTNIYNSAAKIFESTIYSNQQQRANVLSMAPDVFLLGGGLASYLLMTATNYAVSELNTSIIEHANVAKWQRQNIFQQINHTAMIQSIYFDYWNIYKIVTQQLLAHNIRIWLPEEESTTKACNIAKNLLLNNVPQDKIPTTIVDTLSLDPYVFNLHKYLSDNYSTEEVLKINNYFGFDGSSI